MAAVLERVDIVEQDRVVALGAAAIPLLLLRPTRVLMAKQHFSVQATLQLLHLRV